MTRTTLSRISTMPALVECWKKFVKNARKQRSAGVDGVTPADFERQLERNLLQLQKQLLSGYAFSSLRGHLVKKKDGKRYRVICVPTVRDRLVQRLLGAHLTAKADRLGISNGVSFGFLPSTDDQQRGVGAARDRAVELRGEAGWAYKSDITAFFDRIPREQLIEQTVKALNTSTLAGLIEGAVSCEISDDDPAVTRVATEAGIERGRGVRQGMPLSPLFANVILRDFDRTMMRRGKKMVRYADDFIVFANSREECEEIDAIARKSLARLGLDIPAIDAGDKTMIAAPDEDIEFLGLTLRRMTGGEYRLVLTSEHLGSIKQHLHGEADPDMLAKGGITLDVLTRKMDNRIAGYRAAYRCAHNIEELYAILDAAKPHVLASVYSHVFGKDRVSKLSAPMRRFLGLLPPVEVATGKPPRSKRALAESQTGGTKPEVRVS